MLKDEIQKEYDKLSKEKSKDDNMSEDMNMKLRGELEIWAYKDGELIHHDDGHNVVTNWAKHATMHMMTSETYSSHGNRDALDDLGDPVVTSTVHATRSTNSLDHQAGEDGVGINNDGTMISNEQYLGDNTNFFDGEKKYWSVPNPNLAIDHDGDGDKIAGSFQYPFFPTKMLFGTGIEYDSWASVALDGRDGSGLDGYGNPSNGSWSANTFNELLNDETGTSGLIEHDNYYSAEWDEAQLRLLRTRTLNDVYTGALSNDDNPVDADSFGVKGAVKNGTYNGQNGVTVLGPAVDGKLDVSGEYRGIGQPAFIYCTRNERYMHSSSDVALDLGDNTGTEHLESKITFTIIMPEQPTGEFYPYNGHTIKVAGLFADAAMLLRNTVPSAKTGDNDDTTQLEYSSYAKQPTGILWATRNISPIYKSHDTQIIAQWTIYL